VHIDFTINNSAIYRLSVMLVTYVICFVPCCFYDKQAGRWRVHKLQCMAKPISGPLSSSKTSRHYHRHVAYI